MVTGMVNLLSKPTHRPQPKWRWMQFTLRSLLVGVSVFCAWLAWHVELARRQREAINELHELHVAVLYRDPGAGGSERGDWGFAKRLFGMAYREPVEYIGLQHAHEMFHDPQRLERALSLLPHLRGLKWLSLEGMPITDTRLASLKPLTGLRKLNLTYTSVTDAGVAELRQALPNCEIVR